MEKVDYKMIGWIAELRESDKHAWWPHFGTISSHKSFVIGELKRAIPNAYKAGLARVSRIYMQRQP